MKTEALVALEKFYAAASALIDKRILAAAEYVVTSEYPGKVEMYLTDEPCIIAPFIPGEYLLGHDELDNVPEGEAYVATIEDGGEPDDAFAFIKATSARVLAAADPVKYAELIAGCNS